MFPKPSDIEREPETVHVYPDGRERISLLTAAGKREYKRRRLVAWEAQEGLCAICHRWVPWDEATADHIKTRGMGGGSRDDRQENLRMTCWICNSMRGSKPVI